MPVRAILECVSLALGLITLLLLITIVVVAPLSGDAGRFLVLALLVCPLAGLLTGFHGVAIAGPIFRGGRSDIVTPGVMLNAGILALYVVLLLAVPGLVLN